MNFWRNANKKLNDEISEFKKKQIKYKTRRTKSTLASTHICHSHEPALNPKISKECVSSPLLNVEKKALPKTLLPALGILEGLKKFA